MSRLLRIHFNDLHVDVPEGVTLPAFEADDVAVAIPDDVTVDDDELVRAVREGDGSVWPEAEMLRARWAIRVPDLELDAAGIPVALPTDDDGVRTGEVQTDEWRVLGNRLDAATFTVENTDVPAFEHVTVSFTVSLRPGVDPGAAADAMFLLFATAPDDALPGIVSCDSYRVVADG